MGTLWETKLTISAMSGSSGLGSAMSNCMEVSTVEMLSEGLQAPFKEKAYNISEC